MAQIFICNNCDWKPYPGSVILCDDIRKGPYYCPKCEKELIIVDTEESHNQSLHIDRQTAGGE